MPLPTITILGVKVLQISASTALSELTSALGVGQGHSVAFANANLLNMCAGDSTLREALAHSFVLNDGVGINTAARYLYKKPFPDNLNGTDFLPTFLDSIPKGSRIFLLGATRDVNALAVAYLEARWPMHRLIGAHHGYVSNAGLEDILASIEAAHPHVVLVAMGNGLQEKICQRLAKDTRCLCFGVGALFDFWTEKQPRAPLAMRRLGAEWVYRLWREPGRMWRRYLIGNPLFLFRVWRQGLTQDNTSVADEPVMEDPHTTG